MSAAAFFPWGTCVERAGSQCANLPARATIRIRLPAPPQNPLAPLRFPRVPAVFHLAAVCAQPLFHSDRVYDRHTGVRAEPWGFRAHPTPELLKPENA